MDFSYIFKVLYISFFIFILIFAISFVSVSKTNLDSNNTNIRNAIRKSINIGKIRANDDISIDDEILIDNIIRNYVMNNKDSLDEITFKVYKNDNIITVKIIKTNELLNNNCIVEGIFSYEVVRNE